MTDHFLDKSVMAGRCEQLIQFSICARDSIYCPQHEAAPLRPDIFVAKIRAISSAKNEEAAMMRILRLGYAFAIFAICIYAALATYLKGLPPLTPSTTAARAFLGALMTTPFFTPLLAVTYLAGASALLFQRTAPLGIVLLAPSMVVIFFFHIFLTGMVLWGVAWAGSLAVLAWGHRDAFAALVTFQGPARF
jgi:hypothetical protein